MTGQHVFTAIEALVAEGRYREARDLGLARRDLLIRDLSYTDLMEFTDLMAIIEQAAESRDERGVTPEGITSRMIQA